MSAVPASPISSPPEHDNTSVRVCIRVRPLLPYERTINATKILSYPNPCQLLLGHHSSPRPFTFDHVFDDFSTQAQVYADCVRPLVESFLAGYNTTILAYGQTGSGKTHTMGTAAAASSQEDNRDEAAVGIIPRVIRDIFTAIREKEETHIHTVKVAFLEIYNEEICDLLNTTTAAAPYIREGPNNSIVVANALEEEVRSSGEMMAMLVRGSQCRVVGSTQMNATSSRSHAIFTIILSQRKLTVGGSSDDPEEVIQSKFHFVDLAGSERLKRTGAVGDRMKEGININQGLLALGNCISALGGEKKAAHVPFRDSKITRMLQDSLGGNSKTLMIACVSPADVNSDETLNTLKYANRAKNIQNKPIINRDPNSAKIDALRLRIGTMEEAIACWRLGKGEEAEEIMKGLDVLGGTAGVGRGAGLAAGAGAGGGARSGGLEEVILLKDQNLTFEVELKRLSERMKGLRADMAAQADRLVQVETERDVLRLRLERVKDGETKEEDGGPSEVGVLEGNRRTMHRMSRKILHQKRELDSAMRLIEAYTQGGLTRGGRVIISPSTSAMRKRKRKSRRRTNLPSADAGGEEMKEESKKQEEDEDEEDDDSDGGETDDVSLAQADQPLEDGSEGDEIPLTDLSLSEASHSDDQTDSLSLLAEMKEREHENNIRQWTAEGVRLNADLTSKTKELKDFQAQSANVLHLRVQYESRIREMEREIETVQAERDRVLRELETTKHTNLTEYEARYEATVSRYRTQLGQLSDQLKATREKLKENERMKRQLAQDEVRISKLEAEIAAAKKAKVQLAKRVEDSAGKYREWCEMKDNKMKSMLKESRKQTLLLKKMETEFAKQAVVLQRRNEEKAILQKQIKAQTANAGNAAAQQQNSGKSIHQQQASARNGFSSHAASSSRRRSPPSSSPSNSRPPRSTPLRRPPSRRHRESPLARAKAMASNAAALSDSAAPQHGSGATVVSENLLKESIEHEIAAAVERATRLREVEEVKGKKALLQAELNRVQEAMMSSEMTTAAQQLHYSQLEQQCTVMQTTLQHFDQVIQTKEAEVQRLLPQSSPVKGGRTGRKGEEEESVFLSGSEVDYRLFSRIKVGSLDMGKRALVYLIHHAVELSVERGEMQKELERLSREVEEERRKSGEEKRILESRRKEINAMKKCSVTPLQVHYAVQGEDDELHSVYSPRHSASPTPISPPRSPLPPALQSLPPPPPPVRQASPLLTNNFISDDQNVSVEIDHSGSASVGSLAGRGATQPLTAAAGGLKKGGNVFARLTDTSGFTGMYRSIAEEKKHRLPLLLSQKKPPFLSQAQTNNKKGFEPPLKPSLITPTHVQQQQPQAAANAATAGLGTQQTKWLNQMDSPILSWPPLNPPSNPGSSSSSPVNHSDPSQTARPAGSVFSRLTNPQLYTGAHRARFGLDVQTKHKQGMDGTGGDFPPSSLPTAVASAGAGGGGSLSAGGPHREAGSKPSRLLSPGRTHSRQGSHIDYAATYDSAASSSSLPTISDSHHAIVGGEADSRDEALHGLDESANAHDLQFLNEIRREIRQSVERDERQQTGQADGDHNSQDEGRDAVLPVDGDDDDEVRSPRAPVFHFSEDKENNPNSGDVTPSDRQRQDGEGAGLGLGGKQLSSEAAEESRTIAQRGQPWRGTNVKPV